MSQGIAGTRAPKAVRSRDAVAAIAAERFGSPSHDRRLTDKILAAFNHAYATGAVKTATHLKAVLADVEAQERSRFSRRNATAVGQAELWMAFVEARNRYNAAAAGDAAAGDAETALEAMKNAYRAWSDAA